METDINLWQYLAGLFLEWEIFQTNVVSKIKTDILCSVNFLSKNRAVYEIMWQNIIELERQQMIMTHAHSTLDTLGYKHTLTVRNTYCFSTTRMVTRTHLIVAPLQVRVGFVVDIITLRLVLLRVSEYHFTRVHLILLILSVWSVRQYICAKVQRFPAWHKKPRQTENAARDI
jgi:hypothetical protein